MPVEKRSVRRTKIAQVRVRWVHLEQTMITREVSIVRQTKMSIITAADQKSVVLSKGKDATFIRAGCDFQIDLHKTHPLITQIFLCKLWNLWISVLSSDRQRPRRRTRSCKVRRGHAGSLRCQ